MAAEHALDLRQVAGTGPRGRVQLADVRRALEAELPSLSNMDTEAPHD